MTKLVLAKWLAIAVSLVVFTGHAHAGFTISVKPLPKPTQVPVAAPAPAPVQVTPVVAPSVTPQVRLNVAKGESLQAADKAFLSQFGWTPAWLAGEVLAGDAMSFEGKDHEEALTSFLRHYNLVGERFVAEKGYVIRRQTESGAK